MPFEAISFREQLFIHSILKKDRIHIYINMIPHEIIHQYNS